MPTPFSIEIEVRDSECDMQGVVNNAVYLNYLEHARHKFLNACGLDFAKITQSGIHLVAIRVEVDYLSPLKSRDIAIVSVEVERISKLRVGFRQSITRKRDDKLSVNALVVATSLNERGRPFYMAELEGLFRRS
jgi:acyl-CoA thioester hydrolase